MIRKFVDRKSELEFLEKSHEKKDMQFIVIYGRRRVGKTELIKKFIENKEAIYFLADQRGTEKNIERFVVDIQEYFDLPSLRIDSFEDAFKLIAKKVEKKRIVVAIDESSYLIERESALPSVFQYIIDEILKKTNVFLILCGSSISMMERGVLSYKSPLYGRRTGQIKLKPLPFKYVQDFFPNYSITRLIEVYSILGGIPAYLNLFDSNKDIFRNIEETFFIKEHLFYQEPEILIKAELREPKVYFNLLEAMAAGKTKLTDIANRAGIDAKDANSYMNSLIELDLVKKLHLVTEKKPKSKKTLYFIKDNFFRFWFRFILQNKEKIEREKTEILLDEMQNVFPDFVGNAFEDICIEFLWEKSPFSFTQIGKWWGTTRNKETSEKESIEIDIVVLNEKTKEILFGECKWHNRKVGWNVVEELKQKAQLVDWHNKIRKERFLVVSKSGFTKNCLERMHDEEILHWDIKDIKNIIK